MLEVGEDGATPHVDAEPTKHELLAHVGLYYEHPWRPTFALLRRREAEYGDEGFMPVALVRSTPDERLAGPSCRTLWEVIGMINKTVPVDVSCYTLVASPVLAARSLEPWKQRLRPFPVDTLSFWRGQEIEQAVRAAAAAAARAKAAARGRGRGRGARRGGRGGRGVADADALAPGALEDGELEGAVRDDEDFDDDVRDEMLAVAAPEAEGLAADAEAAAIDPFDMPGEEDVVLEDEEDPDARPADPAMAAMADLAHALGLSDADLSDASSIVEELPGGVLKCKIAVDGYEKKGRLYAMHMGDRLEFQAVCPCHLDERCRRKRNAKAGKKSAQGRPLGSLVAWLRGVAAHGSKDEHMKWNPPRDERLAGRDIFQEMDDSADWFALERDKGDGEESEPEECAEVSCFSGGGVCDDKQYAHEREGCDI